MKEILITFRKVIIIFLFGICVILLIPTIYGYFNQADLNNITDRKYKRENSQYLITSISKDDYYYFDFYQDKNGTVWLDDYTKKVGEIDDGYVSVWTEYLKNVDLKPENIRIEWEKKEENGQFYDVAYLIIEIDGIITHKTPHYYYEK